MAEQWQAEYLDFFKLKPVWTLTFPLQIRPYKHEPTQSNLNCQRHCSSERKIKTEDDHPRWWDDECSARSPDVNVTRISSRRR